MRFTPLDIPDVILVEPSVYGDDRGFFMETWQASRFRKAGIDADFVQDNHSRSGQWILRGLHYQIRQPQGKLVRVVSGEVLDVAVDIRQGSPTFGRWVSHRLSEENKEMIWVPPGFAHGFIVQSETADFLYKCTDFYAPEHERCIRWDDPEISIDWQLPEGIDPVVSEKDRAGLPIGDADLFEYPVGGGHA